MYIHIIKHGHLDQAASVMAALSNRESIGGATQGGAPQIVATGAYLRDSRQTFSVSRYTI